MKKFIKLKTILFLLGFILFSFSFITNDLKSTTLPEGNIIFVLDVSNSMNVNDVFYNGHSVSRLTLSKKIIENNIDKIKRPFGLILFSDKFDYFIPPTLDIKTFKTYLKTVNTNILDGGNMHFVENLKNIQEVLNPSDTLVLMSDFDTDENLKKISLKNYVYVIGIGTKQGGIVKNKDGIVLYKDGDLLYSSLKIDKLKEFPTNDYKIISSYEKGQILDFLKNFKNKNLIKKQDEINYIDIASFVLLILSL